MKLLHGDALEMLNTIEDETIDAMITDPPAGIGFMGKAWDKDKGGRGAWIEWLQAIMSEALRVLKPGAHAFVWALPRTSHWTATALENAGFEIRDRLAHVFGSGFPKNHDVSKAFDRMSGDLKAESMAFTVAGSSHIKPGKILTTAPSKDYQKPQPATPDAKRWQGWGTALKPAVEDWWLCRKPLEGTIAANVLSHGTGALNIDGSRIKHDEDCKMMAPQKDLGVFGGRSNHGVLELKPSGRWPAHLILSHAPGCGDVCVVGCPIRLMGEQSGECKTGSRNMIGVPTKNNGATDFTNTGDKQNFQGDEGTAARYFLNLDADPFLYCAKPGNEERNAGLAGEIGTIDDGRNTPSDNPYQRGETERRNVHPTVKPVDLMRWLCKLITPPGGTVLDPFMGSGTTGIAARLEGFDFVGIEREDEYIETARARIEYAEKYDLRRRGKTKIDPRQMSMF